jgi:hypothetical protein
MAGKIANMRRNSRQITRRSFLKTSGVAAALSGAGLGSALADSETLPKVSEDDPMAKALNYVENAKTVDAAKRQSDRFCNNCSLYAGDAEDKWAGCGIFPGKSVAGAGWCSAWAPK